MTQDKNMLDEEEGVPRSEPTLSLPSQGSASSPSDDDASEPPFQYTPPTPMVPPPIPGPSSGAPSPGGFIPATGFIPSANPAPATPPPAPELPAAEKAPLETPEQDVEPADAVPRRRMARRRSAGPSRNRIAANDDGPSIGGLIFALQQKPSNAPYKFAGMASIVWGGLGVAFILASITNAGPMVGWLELLARPTTFLTIAAIIVPIALLWLMAILAWRTEELRLRSSTMTEVAIRLAEPDRLAEQNAASLGQAVRRQVGFMNDAVSRALGRAAALASSKPWCTTRSPSSSAPTRTTSARSAASFPSFPANATPW